MRTMIYTLCLFALLGVACDSGDNPSDGDGDADGDGDGDADGDGDGDVSVDIGAPCRSDEGCLDGTCMTWLPGGYCTLTGCGEDLACPRGSVCAPVRGGGDEQTVCLKLCDMLDDCRTDEGYVCDRDATCWPVTPEERPRPIGSPCGMDTDCDTQICMFEYYDDQPTGMTDGMCALPDCGTGGCPAGSNCADSPIGSACLPRCLNDSECRAGYSCDVDDWVCRPGCEDNETCPDKHICLADYCMKAADVCSVTNPAGWCPGGRRCDLGDCRSSSDCGDDSGLEPNDTLEDAVPLDRSRLFGLEICEGDEDWYEIEAPAGQLTEASLVFSDHSGNLDLVAHSESGEFLRSLWRSYPYTGELISDFDVSSETITFYPADRDRTYYLRVVGEGDATNPYGLIVRRYPYEDGTSCEESFSQEECTGLPGGILRLYQFPLPAPDDHYGGDLYDFSTVGSYFWVRREMIMLVRQAIRDTYDAFPGTNPIFLIDASQRDGITPGYDIASPRHCRTCHDQGGNIDITYYSTEADNWTRTVCGPRGANVTADGLQCTAAAETGHILDVDRQVFFLARLFESPLTRAIGVDPVLGEVIRARATEMEADGLISSEGLAGIRSQFGLWATHHDHIHLSLNWW